MVVVVELSVVPLGSGVSVSRLVAEAVKALEEMGLKYQVTPMCTVFEASSVEEAFKAASGAHEAVFKAGALRVLTTVKVDERRDRPRARMEEKVESLRRAIED
ncbi:MAG: thiamine-binding protein [Candidatus Hecatellales archaeon]|nr:MAG: thiamine-binding protein [Candidatus Hecatellales archaeon]